MLWQLTADIVGRPLTLAAHVTGRLCLGTLNSPQAEMLLYSPQVDISGARAVVCLLLPAAKALLKLGYCSVLPCCCWCCRYNFLLYVPYQLERIMIFGTLLCLYSFVVRYC